MSAATTPVRPELSPLPPRMTLLPVDERGYPVPWFVAWVDGKPDHRVADARKRETAVRHNLCWVCGQTLGKMKTWVIGPMCGINRVSSEPPCHHDCALWSATNCPFLSKPWAKRRDNDLPEGAVDPDGQHVERNPGVTLLWTAKDFRVVGDGRGGWLVRVGDPEKLEWFAEGRAATRREVTHSVETGLPTLLAICQGDRSQEDELYRCRARLEVHYPKE